MERKSVDRLFGIIITGLAFSTVAFMFFAGPTGVGLNANSLSPEQNQKLQEILEEKNQEWQRRREQVIVLDVDGKSVYLLPGGSYTYDRPKYFTEATIEDLESYEKREVAESVLKEKPWWVMSNEKFITYSEYSTKHFATTMTLLLTLLSFSMVPVVSGSVTTIVRSLIPISVPLMFVGVASYFHGAHLIVFSLVMCFVAYVLKRAAVKNTDIRVS